jgi:sulfur-carrier protein adenylyltransferase/sulfurtransferase
MFRLRYAGHLLAPAIGLRGQLRLLDARVLLAGVGGLGSASGLYLAAAGVGTLGIVDDDVVEISNLHRQVLHTTDRVGVAKVDSAEQSIAAINPDVHVVKHMARLDASNVMDIVDGYDVIVDGLDNFATRYLLNEAAVDLGTPVVSAAIFDVEGQLSVFVPHVGPCYECVYRVPAPAEGPSSCVSAGVLGVLPGVMGTLQAAEVVKLVTGSGDPLIGRLLVYDALVGTFTELKFERNRECRTCGAPSREATRRVSVG